MRGPKHVDAAEETLARRESFAAARVRMASRTIPQLIELLSSEDLRMRFLAEMCLRESAGT